MNALRRLGLTLLAPVTAVVAAMAEVGIDITEEFPKPWTDEVVRAADVVVTMGCGDACPLYPGKRYEDWVLDDPAGQSLETVRAIRDDIRARVETASGRRELQHALAAATELGEGTRVVSMPCFERFERQPEKYRREVLPNECRRRVAIDAHRVIERDRDRLEITRTRCRVPNALGRLRTGPAGRDLSQGGVVLRVGRAPAGAESRRRRDEQRHHRDDDRDGTAGSIPRLADCHILRSLSGLPPSVGPSVMWTSPPRLFCPRPLCPGHLPSL